MSVAGSPILNFSQLVERLVPLIGELFATLACRDPLRMSFANLAESTLLDIVNQLRREGLSHEVIADSLGMTVAGYRRKVKKLAEIAQSRMETGQGGDAGPRTEFEEIYRFVAEVGADGTPVPYLDIEAFCEDMSADRLTSALSFLVRYGLLSVTGQGVTRRYILVPRPSPRAAGYYDAVVLLYRSGPLTLPEMAARLALPEAVCAGYLERLRAEGSLEEHRGPGAGVRFRATRYHIPVDTPEGFEAALWDHFHTVIAAVCKKVRLTQYNAAPGELEGGATYSFDVPAGHPLLDEITAFLRKNREQLEVWLEAVRPFGAAPSQDRMERVTVYLGQMVEPIHGDSD